MIKLISALILILSGFSLTLGQVKGNAEQEHFFTFYDYCITQDEESIDWPTVAALLNHVDSTDCFEAYEKLKERKQINLSIFGRTIKSIAPLAGLDNIEYLNLEDTQVSDLSPVRNLRNLRFINLNRTNVTDLSPLRVLPYLTRLFYDGGKISDVSQICELEQIQVLSLMDNQYPFRNIRCLATINLIHLNLHGSYMEKEDLKFLQDNMPNCSIYPEWVEPYRVLSIIRSIYDDVKTLYRNWQYLRNSQSNL